MWQQVSVKKSCLWQVSKWRGLPWLIHGFTTREWGNLALHIHDNQQKVIQRRKQLSQAFGVSLDSWVVGNQVHKVKIMQVDTGYRGCGARSMDSALQNTDGLITQHSKLFLVSFYADCVPLLFIEPDKQIIAMAHAGWKGTAARIGQLLIKKLIKLYGVKPDKLQIAIGPSIGSCCYQVDQSVAQQFEPDCIEYTGQGIFLDLWAANKSQLIKHGVQRENIHTANLCTYCHNQFFSYRRDKDKAGRMAAFMYINQ